MARPAAASGCDRARVQGLSWGEGEEEPEQRGEEMERAALWRGSQGLLITLVPLSPDWATFALGPGHGIQLRSGRLLVPAYSYHIDLSLIHI